MKAILIDATKQTITEVQYDGDIDTIYKLCGYDCFTCCDIGHGDAIYVDDEGLFKQPHSFFLHGDYPQPLAGNGLILGCDQWGESIAPTTTLTEVRAKVSFMDVSTAMAWAKSHGV